eukprot:360901-Rhodomonas_salina.4
MATKPRTQRHQMQATTFPVQLALKMHVFTSAFDFAKCGEDIPPPQSARECHGGSSRCRAAGSGVCQGAQQQKRGERGGRAVHCSPWVALALLLEHDQGVGLERVFWAWGLGVLSCLTPNPKPQTPNPKPQTLNVNCVCLCGLRRPC